MDKEAVSALGISDLASFPLDDFFDHYEKGLRKVCNLNTVVTAVCWVNSQAVKIGVILKTRGMGSSPSMGCYLCLS